MVFQPVGPETPDVYWRRRAAMLGVLGVALVLVLAMCARGGGSGDARAAAATASTSASASAGASVDALGGGLDDPLSSTDPSAGAAASGAAESASPHGTAASDDATASGGAHPAALAATRAPAASGAAVPEASASGDAAASQDPAASLDPAAAELAASSSPSAATTSPSGAPLPGGTCADSALRVAVSTDARTYAAGAQPRITLTVTNTGTSACTRDVGSAALSVVVTSGPDRIWSSDDCGGKGTAKLTTLPAGASWSTSVTWSATRTSPGNCTARVPAKSGFYQVAASAGGVSSSLYRFHLG